MATKKKKHTKSVHLTLHNLIGAVSYWGAATRISVIGFIALAVFLIQVLEQQASPTNMSLLSAVLIEGQMLVYVVVSFFLLDVGYVTIARKYRFAPMQDKVLLISSEFFLGLMYFLPYFAIVSDRFTHVTRFVFVAVLLVLSMRIVLGMLYGKEAQK
ncbi:hypothetical protein H7Y40_01275 [Pedobacter sp.]|nr:hypothetical protein [Candidatus Saccharibacteria bacterium]